MVNNDQAGKPKFANIATKYQAAAAPAENPAAQEKPAAAAVAPLDAGPQGPERRVRDVARNMTAAVRESVDRSITGRKKHPAYKGERVARTYQMPVELDQKLEKIYAEEGVEKQANVIKAVTKWLEDKYPNVKV